MFFSLKANGFCILYQYWEIWATNEKKFFDNFFHLFFAEKKSSMKKLTSFLSQTVAYGMFVQFTKSWILYLVSVLRYRWSKTKNRQKSVFLTISFKNDEADFLEFFRRKCSRGSCATFSEIMVSIYVMGVRKFASKLWKVGTSQNLRKKASSYGHLAKLEPQKRHHMGTSQSSRPKNVAIWGPRKARAPLPAHCLHGHPRCWLRHCQRHQ